MKSFLRALLLIVLAALTAAGCAYSRLKVSYPERQCETIPTDDGWGLFVVHYKPEQPRPGAYPVVMCHGATSTTVVFDMDEQHSLARYFVERGFEVYVVNLRGRAGTRNRPPAQGPRTGWSFDDHFEHDVPAIVDYVIERSGRPKLNWIGHSMGGMLIYSYLGCSGDERVNSVVAIASPMIFYGDDYTKALTAVARRTPRCWKTMRMRTLARLAAPLADDFNSAAFMTANVEGFEDEVLTKYVYNSIPNISMVFLRQLGRMAETRELWNEQRTMNYQDCLAGFHAPLLAIAGKLDYLGTPEAVRLAFDRVSSIDKTYRVFGRANGNIQDYGHGDVVISDAATAEIYPYIFEWVAAH